MIQPSDFLEQARNLIQTETEVNCRSAISRGYYSLYHEAFEFLINRHKHKFIKKIKSELSQNSKIKEINYQLIESLDKKYLGTLQINWHQTLKDMFHLLSKNRFGSKLGTMRDDRNFADYQINENLDINARIYLECIGGMVSQLHNNNLN